MYLEFQNQKHDILDMLKHRYTHNHYTYETTRESFDACRQKDRDFFSHENNRFRQDSKKISFEKRLHVQF
jgi:hypothetical protein